MFMKEFLARKVLARAVLKAGMDLGIVKRDLYRLTSASGRTLVRRGIDPRSPGWKRSEKLIRIHRALSVLVGGESDLMRLWMHTYNQGTGGIPAKQILKEKGLGAVVSYLEDSASRLL
jgi:hypothetical protein